MLEPSAYIYKTYETILYDVTYTRTSLTRLQVIQVQTVWAFIPTLRPPVFQHVRATKVPITPRAGLQAARITMTSGVRTRNVGFIFSGLIFVLSYVVVNMVSILYYRIR